MYNSTTATALRLRAELGLGSFPVDAETKRPRYRAWQRSYLRAPEAITKVFERIPDGAGVGVPTGQPLAGRLAFSYVLDVDERNGGLEALAELPELPETVTAKTPNGWHYWFCTTTPQPGQFRNDGLELKGAGQFVLWPLEPPAAGRHWLRDPYEFEIAECPEWLLPPSADMMKEQATPLRSVVDAFTGEVTFDYSNCYSLEMLRRAKPGSRHTTLLKVAGTIGREVRLGLRDEQSARVSLLEAAQVSGMSEEEFERLTTWCFTHDRLSTCIGKQERTLVHELSHRELSALEVLTGKYTRLIDASGVPYEKHCADICSTRWLANQLGLRHPQQAARCLETLCAAGLLWKSPTSKRLRAGAKPCHRYKPTYVGMALASS